MPTMTHGYLQQAVKMTSVRTQLPYEYYTLPFCRPGDEEDKLQYKSLNLGKCHLLRGREGGSGLIHCTVLTGMQHF